jgi:hypothetical protein
MSTTTGTQNCGSRSIAEIRMCDRPERGAAILETGRGDGNAFPPYIGSSAK